MRDRVLQSELKDSKNCQKASKQKCYLSAKTTNKQLIHQQKPFDRLWKRKAQNSHSVRRCTE